MNPSVALIIRCHNEEAHIGRLLTGALHQSRVPDEIILVDSGSTDATVSIAAAFPTTILTISPDEFSFGRALNVGLAAAKSEIAVFASAHVYPVYDSWIDLLVQPFQDERIALTYGRQQAPADGRFSEQQLLARWFPTKSVARQREPFCNNANAAVRSSVWEEIPYDEQLTGLEDLDWARRALERGHELSYVAEASVVHAHDESFRQVINRYRREAIAHKAIYDERGMRFTTAVRLGAANIVGDLRSARRQGALSTHLADIVQFRSAQFYGTYRGFRQRGPVTELLRQRFYYPPDAEHHVLGEEQAAGSLIDYDVPPPKR